MASLDPEGTADDSVASVTKRGSDLSGLTPGRGSEDTIVGSPEHLQSTFARAAAAVDRTAGVWGARNGPVIPDDVARPREDRNAGDFRALRALVRASATAYARRLRTEGTTPERMVVLVKAAATHHGVPEFSVQELTNDIVRWSIEAYFDD